MGWAMGSLMADTKIGRVEAILVGVFGAFIGGEFIADMFRGAAAAASQGLGTKLILAAGSAGVMLAMLAVLRHAVGPQQKSKSRARH